MGIEDIASKEFKLRPMKCELNFLSKSDGSAILSQGNILFEVLCTYTQLISVLPKFRSTLTRPRVLKVASFDSFPGETVVLASVNGPLDVKMQSQSIEKSTLEVLFCTKGGKPSVGDRYKENIIRQTCETCVLGSVYPRTAITITIQELEDYGGLLSCSLNCVCLALLNSGVAMRCVYAAVSCAVEDTGNIVLEPTHQQLETARANMSFVFESREKTLITSFTEGTFSEDTYKEALERCRAASDLIFGFYRDIVSKYCNVIG